jgi:uncharacterized phage-associated protein
METLNITPERFQQALAWMNGQASTLGEKEVLQMLRSLTARFQENCRALRPGPVALFRGVTLRPHPLSLSAIVAEAEARIEMEKAEKKPSVVAEENPYLRELMEDDVPEGATPVEKTSSPEKTPEQAVMEKVAQESRLDSVVLINAIAYVAALAGYPLTQSKAQLILYGLYGSRLGAGKERLPIEHPQVWRYGPVFPRAYKRGAIEDRGACESSYQELLESEPAILTALSTKTQSMMATPMADLNAVHKSAQSPYGRAKARYPEKWGVQIPDEEIAAFFRGTVPKKKAE